MKLRRYLICLLFALLFVRTIHVQAATLSNGYLYNVNADGTTCTIMTSVGLSGDITIPDTLDGYRVTSIGAGAWGMAGSTITSIMLPNSVTSIANNAFLGCNKLSSIVVDTGNTNFSSMDGVLYNFDKSTLICYPAGKNESTFCMPDNVTYIDNFAFVNCTLLKSISFSNKVTSIGYYSLGGSGLTSITIPNSVTTIAECAFYGCTSLKNIEIPDSVTSIGESAFQSCSSLISVTIPNSMTSISPDLFQSCSNLISVTIPDSVVSIGFRAFGYCTSLTEITIPDSVTSIGALTFQGCTSLTAMYFDGNMPAIGEEVFYELSVPPQFYCPAGNSGGITTPVTELETKSITVSSSVYGTITPSQINGMKDEMISLEIKPDEGYRLKSLVYNDASGDHGISGTSFTMPNNAVTISGIFEMIHEVTVTASPSASGIVYGGGIYNADESVTVTAVPMSGYGFVDWTEGVTEVSTSADYTFKIGADRALTANFAPLHEVSVAASPLSAGTVSGSDTYNEGASVTVTAVPVSGYSFVSWAEGSTEVSTNDTYTFILGTTDVELTANFMANPVTYKVTFRDWNGTELKVQTVEEGKKATAPTDPVRTGYIFTGWDKSFNYITEDLTITAEYIEYIAPVTDADRAAQDKAALSIGFAAGDSADAVTEDITLIDKGTINGSTITWKSSNEDVITNEGKVIRPYFSSKDAHVTVSALVYYNGANSQKDFELTVLKLDAALCNVQLSANPLAGGAVSGSGKYSEGASVTVTAAVYAGYTFLDWTEGGNQVSTSSCYTFTAGQADRILVANFTANPVETYTVVFKNWDGTELGTQIVECGKNATAPADPTRLGYTFTGWDKAFSNVTADLTITAQYDKNSSHKSKKANGSTTAAVTSEIMITSTENTVTATTTCTAIATDDGRVRVTETLEQVSNILDSLALEQAKLSESKTSIAEFNIIGTEQETKTVEIILPKTAVDALAGSDTDALTISTSIAQISFDAEALDKISDTVLSDVTISAALIDAQSLSEDTRKIFGERPVFDFSVTSGEKTISQFEGKVTVSVPYAPKEGEDADSILIYYINSEGNLEMVRDSAYDNETGRINFMTSHFSRFGVGYNKVSFKDIPDNAWYEKAVNFIAARKIAEGTGNGNYCPEAEITRGEFIVMLMKAYGISPDKNNNDNFKDCGSTYYTDYLAAAKRLGISKGTENNMFAPEEKITRQEMFTLLYNVLRTIGELPTGKTGKNLSDFTDSEQVDVWARDAILTFVESGLVNGNEEKLFVRSTTTRAEMAQVLYNLLLRQKS